MNKHLPGEVAQTSNRMMALQYTLNLMFTTTRAMSQVCTNMFIYTQPIEN